MLTEGDIKFIKGIREEVRKNRTEPVIIYGQGDGRRHPITGELIEDKVEHTVPAIVTLISVRTAVDRYIDLGIEIRTGDIIVDISIDDIPDGFTAEGIEDVKHDGIKFKVIASDKLGLGDVNRIEVVGRRVK